MGYLEDTYYYFWVQIMFEISPRKIITGTKLFLIINSTENVEKLITCNISIFLLLN